MSLHKACIKMDTLKKYNNLNNSFKKELIFHVGAEGGFYSEFINMVFAILYCLKYEYKFVLYSADANFGIDKGWTDFFEPFCKETKFSLHTTINKRTTPPTSLSTKKNTKFKLYKFLFRKTFLTYELWDNFYSPVFEKETFNIPQLDINGNLKEASQKIIEMIYRYNDKTKKEITSLIDNLKLPSDYLALHVRRGDKETEFKFADLDLYINKLREIPNVKALFVSTDDVRVTESIVSNYKDYNVYSLEDKNDLGYFHASFLNYDQKKKESHMIKMFAAMEVICASNFAIGTYTSNVGLFLGARMSKGKFYSVRKKSWYQFEVDDIV